MHDPSGTTFVVGSYTAPYGAFRAMGEGLTLIRLDPAGQLRRLDNLILPNPAYVLPIGKGVVGAVLETDDDRAGIALLQVDGDRLQLVQSIAVPGNIPCHLDVHPTGSWLAGVCYGTGDVLSVPLDADGRMIGQDLVATRHHGHGRHPVRQTKPHPHATRFSPDGNWLVVADLGIDQVVSYRFDTVTGPDFSTARVWASPPGSGPRLPLFSPDGLFVVLVEELSCMLVSLSWQDGALSEVCRVSSLIEPFEGENTAAGLRWHPSGRLVGVSNRGADSIALCHFDDGRLTPWREFSCGGAKPRDFAFPSCGKWIIAAAQNSDVLAVFSIDENADTIIDTGERLVVKSPACVQETRGEIRY